MDFVGKICPFCKTKFEANDDVVVCSVCEMPHHKECWIENKSCTTFGCTGTIQGIDEETSKEINKAFCGGCGSQVDLRERFCSKCGTMVQAPDSGHHYTVAGGNQAGQQAPPMINYPLQPQGMSNSQQNQFNANTQYPNSKSGPSNKAIIAIAGLICFVLLIIISSNS